jgi:hypothetical protein
LIAPTYPTFKMEPAPHPGSAIPHTPASIV